MHRTSFRTSHETRLFVIRGSGLEDECYAILELVAVLWRTALVYDTKKRDLSPFCHIFDIDMHLVDVSRLKLSYESKNKIVLNPCIACSHIMLDS